MPSPKPEAAPRSVNPATEDVLNEYAYATHADIEAALERGARAQVAWRAEPLSRRADLLRRAGQLLTERKDEIARTVTLEMGKPLGEAQAEIAKSAFNCAYVADNAPAWLADIKTPSNATESYLSFLPLGVIFAVMPWNFPIWQVFRYAASTLMAGNTTILKHAPNVLGCAAAIQKLMLDAGFPEGVFQNLPMSVADVAPLIADRRIAGVTLTGSPRAGASVASLAGAACKKSVLELGGSDAFIVLEDADIEAAVDAAVRGRFSNAGQVCLATKRLILLDQVADDFEARFIDKVSQLKVGDPLQAGVNMGPMARGDLRNQLDGQVRRTIDAGARLVLGGAPVEGRGFFYQPTVLTGIQPGQPAAEEETFGPVAALMRVPDAESAIRIANESDYGLSSNIWTQDLDRARTIARRMEAGGVFINGASASDPRLPVGGVKLSGYGRELGPFGTHEFTNIQTVWIGPAVQPGAPMPAD
jgi:acyl-CoA reductase-like NAD-dependent aldehyde dehydrogenase